MITICSAANEPYLPYIKGLVCSARENFPSARVVIELVNVDKQERKAFSRNHPDCKVLTSYTEEDERVYCSNRKCNVLMTAREMGGHDTLLWIDADSIIRKDCKDFEYLFKKDLAVRVKNTTYTIRDELINEVYSGIFSFGNTKHGNKLLRQYVALAKDHQYFGSDQDNLAYIYGTHRNCNLGVLPDYLVDFDVKWDSPIWTLRCKPKTINGRFHKERDKYLETWIK